MVVNADLKKIFVKALRDVLDATEFTSAGNSCPTTDAVCADGKTRTFVPVHGICAVLDMCMGYRDAAAVADDLRQVMDDWPRHSGRAAYPVPHPEKEPGDAFDDASSWEMWSPNHPYGAARRPPRLDAEGRPGTQRPHALRQDL